MIHTIDDAIERLGRFGPSDDDNSPEGEVDPSEPVDPTEAMNPKQAAKYWQARYRAHVAYYAASRLGRQNAEPAD